MALINKENLSKEVGKYYTFEYDIYLKDFKAERKEMLIVDKFSEMGELWRLINIDIDNIKSLQKKGAQSLNIESRLAYYTGKFINMSELELIKQNKTFNKACEIIIPLGYYPCRLIS